MDPGLKGGYGMINSDGLLLSYGLFPVIKVGKKNELDLHKIDGLFKNWKNNFPRAKIIVALERVSAFRGQGVTSMFNFGKGYGALIGIIVSNGCSLISIRPQEWKKEMIPEGNKDKGASIMACKNLRPEAELIPKGCKKAQDGIAESILLAEYTKRKER